MRSDDYEEKDGTAVAGVPADSKDRQCPMPWDGWSVLQGSPRELWLVYIIKMLGSYSYFVLSMNLTLYLTDEYGYSDTEAGWIYGTFGLLIAIFGLFLGLLIDYLGVKWSLVLGCTCSVIGRYLVFDAESHAELLIGLYFFLPIAEALNIPVLTIGIKRYTHKANQTIAFGLFYAAMNVSALAAGNLTTVLMAAYGCEDGTTTCPPEETGAEMFGKHYSVRRLLIFSGIIPAILALLLAGSTFREINVGADGEAKAFKTAKPGMKEFRKTLADPNFHRLAVLVSCMTLVRLIFRVLDAAFPKYMERNFNTKLWGTIYSINPFMIIFLVPLVALYTVRVRHIRMIVSGSFVSASSPFALLFNTIAASVLFVVILSIGESVYSPRMYDFTMGISPSGAEGFYTALASAPMFLAKFLVGPLSGSLLRRFCSLEAGQDLVPECLLEPLGEGEVDTGAPMCDACPEPGKMWAILGLISLTGPIVVFFIRDWVSPPGLFENEQIDKSADAGVLLGEDPLESADEIDLKTN